MARETGIMDIQPVSSNRQTHTFLDASAFLATAALNHFSTDNITGAVVWVKATSTAGTPNYTLSLESSPDEVDGNFVNVTAISRPEFAAINDETAHIYMINMANCHKFARFKITLNGGDGGDDIVTFKTCFLYGSFTNAADVTLETGDLEIGAVELKNAATDDRALISDANTARAATDHVLEVQTLDAGGVVGGVQGNIAHDAVDSGNPVKIGGKASASKPTAVAANDRVSAYFDLFGRQHVYDEGGGGVSGGGFSTYTFTPTNSFGDGTSAYASATTFTVSGHSFTPEAVALVKVDRFSAAGAFQESLSPAQNTITAATVAGVTTYTYAAGAFTAGDLFVVYQGGPERTVSKATDSQRVEEISPLNQQVLEESWADTTNVGAGPTYYPSADGAAMIGYNDISFTGKFIEADAENNTLTIEGTNDEDATSTNRDWITLYGYRPDTDTIVASIGCNATTTTYAWDFDNCNYKYVRAKFVGGASATNTVIIKARRKAL